MNFKQKLSAITKQNNSLLCIGLDPLLDKLPSSLRSGTDPLFAFNKAVIDATADLVCAYKPQIAYYSAQSAEHQLQKTIEYLRKHHPHIPVILDAKRGDIGATSEQYAREIFDRYKADATTVNPYMGTDSLQPFLDRKDRGVFILCHTSNPGAEDLQKNIYRQVACLARERWNRHHNVGLVAGASVPDRIGDIRTIIGEDIPLLIPGIGTQGGNLPSCMNAGKNALGAGLLINSSRAIIHAPSIRQAALQLREEINKYR